MAMKISRKQELNMVRIVAQVPKSLAIGLEIETDTIHISTQSLTAQPVEAFLKTLPKRKGEDK